MSSAVFGLIRDAYKITDCLFRCVTPIYIGIRTGLVCLHHARARQNVIFLVIVVVYLYQKSQAIYKFVICSFQNIQEDLKNMLENRLSVKTSKLLEFEDNNL